MTAQALILDFGGVITRTLFETHRDTENALGLPTGSLTWRGPFDPANDPLWRRMQANEIAERDYWHIRACEVGELVGERWDGMEDFLRRARTVDPDAVIRPEAKAAVRAARMAGRRAAILSNELDLFYGTGFGERVSFMREFEVIIDATYTKILKPDPRAYRLVLEALSLPAAACVFVDDQARNIAGAEAAGMVTVSFDVRNPKSSFDEALRCLGVPVA